MNRLRAIAVACGVVLLASAVFGAVEYGASAGLVPFLTIAVLGVIVAAAPDVLARAKNTIHQRRRDLQGADTRTGTKDRYYVGTEPFTDRDRALDTVRDVLANAPEFDRVSMDEFPEGNGLSVRHGGFHGSFVRVTNGGHLVLAGASERTGDLATTLSDALDTAFDRSWSNPLRRSKPVSGGLRIVLGVALIAVTVVGVGGVAATGYPSSAYNPMEKAALASYDARAMVLPGTSATDAAIGKARFRVDALREADTEVAWSQNGSGGVYVSGRHARAVAGDTRSSLAALRNDDLTPTQRARVDTISTDLRGAEIDVANALDHRLDEGNVTHVAGVRNVAAQLRNHHVGTTKSNNATT